MQDLKTSLLSKLYVTNQGNLKKITATAGKVMVNQVLHAWPIMLKINTTLLKKNLEMLKENLKSTLMLHTSIQKFHIWESIQGNNCNLERNNMHEDVHYDVNYSSKTEKKYYKEILQQPQNKWLIQYDTFSINYYAALNMKIKMIVWKTDS